MIKTGNTDYKEKIIDSFKVLELNLNDSDTINAIRGKAIKAFHEKGFPTRKDEEWKYTNIHPHLKDEYEPRINPHFVELTEEELLEASLGGIKSNFLVFINGYYAEQYSSIIDEKIKFSSLNDSLSHIEKGIRDSLDNVINRDNDPFVHLNTAFMQDGAVLEIPDNTVLEHPVLLVYIEKETDGHYLDQPRNILKVGKNCQVKLITNFINFSGENKNLSNILTQVTVGQNSQVELYTMQHTLQNGLQLNFVEATVERDSKFSSFCFTSSGDLVRNVLNIVLNGENSEGHMYGLYQLDGKEHCDNRTFVDHAVPNCYSNELYKGILYDSSTGVFNGKIMVRPDAQKTNAFQHNANLLLSNNASFNTKPQLEIFADDVKCSHGATSGQMDEEALFYLRSRGLGKEDAKALLTYAFANEVIDHVTIPEIKEYLVKRTQGKLMIH